MKAMNDEIIMIDQINSEMGFLRSELTAVIGDWRSSNENQCLSQNQLAS